MTDHTAPISATEHPEIEQIVSAIERFVYSDEVIQEALEAIAIRQIGHAWMNEEDQHAQEDFVHLTSFCLNVALGRVIGRSFFDSQKAG